MKRIIVTGALGKVGANFIDRVLKSDDCLCVHIWTL